MIWQCSRASMDLRHRARIMGILNVTPDSFSDGGHHADPSAAIQHARQLIAQGAEIIDVGGESTRPGSLPVDAEEEIRRTLPVIRALRACWDGWISIDTMKAAVAEAALTAGADVVNDVSGLRADPAMPALCAAAGCAVVVMHMRGTPATMQNQPSYADVCREVRDFFEIRLHELRSAGLRENALCFDPGIGFGKTLAHNLELLRNLATLAPAGRPLLLGVSRKSFLGTILNSSDIAEREWPTVALTARAREQGVMLHRVHAVLPNMHALRMTEAIMTPQQAGGTAS